MLLTQQPQSGGNRRFLHKNPNAGHPPKAQIPLMKVEAELLVPASWGSQQEVEDRLDPRLWAPGPSPPPGDCASPLHTTLCGSPVPAGSSLPLALGAPQSLSQACSDSRSPRCSFTSQLPTPTDSCLYAASSRKLSVVRSPPPSMGIAFCPVMLVVVTDTALVPGVAPAQLGGGCRAGERGRSPTWEALPLGPVGLEGSESRGA